MNQEIVQKRFNIANKHQIDPLALKVEEIVSLKEKEILEFMSITNIIISFLLGGNSKNENHKIFDNENVLSIRRRYIRKKLISEKRKIN